MNGATLPVMTKCDNCLWRLVVRCFPRQCIGCGHPRWLFGQDFTTESQKELALDFQHAPVGIDCGTEFTGYGVVEMDHEARTPRV